MPIVLGTAMPDCDYKDPKATLIIRGQEGCPRQAKFKIWIENVDDGAFKDKPIHACPGHASQLFHMFKAMAKEMRRMKEKVVVKVVDITAEPLGKQNTRVLLQTAREKASAMMRKTGAMDLNQLKRFLASKRRH